jgi:glutathione S-transferase
VARASLRVLFAREDAQLAGRDWVAGTRAIVDPYLYVVLRWAKAMNVDLSGLGNLERFFNAMQSDAGVRRALEQEGLA